MKYLLILLLVLPIITKEGNRSEIKIKIEIKENGWIDEEIKEIKSDKRNNLSLSYAETYKLLLYIEKQCKSQDIQLKTVLTVISIESGWNHLAEGPINDIGLMQITPICARQCKVEHNKLFNPFLNVKTGIKYLKEAKLRTKSLNESLVYYNAGAKNAYQMTKEEIDNFIYVVKFRNYFRK